MLMNPDVKRADREGYGWEEVDSFFRRKYPDYSTYVRWQTMKLDQRPGWCRTMSEELRVHLGQRLKDLRAIKPGMSVLCLGARLGGEVLAFLDNGCFAVGIDLNPGSNNGVVLHGDFHELQFADDSIDLVYYNSLDHCIDPMKVLGEIHRVLIPRGRLMLELKAGSNEPKKKNMGSDHWDCLEWSNIDSVVVAVEQAGFDLKKQYHDRTTRANPNGYIFRRCDEERMD